MLLHLTLTLALTLALTQVVFRAPPSATPGMLLHLDVPPEPPPDAGLPVADVSLPSAPLEGVNNDGAPLPTLGLGGAAHMGSDSEAEVMAAAQEGLLSRAPLDWVGESFTPNALLDDGRPGE